MDLSDWMVMWLGKYMVHAIILIAFFAIVAVGMFVAEVRAWSRHRKCAHQRIRETMGCDAICIECAKNLGFIGAWRDKKKGGE